MIPQLDKVTVRKFGRKKCLVVKKQSTVCQFNRVQSISSWLSELGQIVPLQRQMMCNPLLVFAPLERFRQPHEIGVAWRDS